MWPGVRLPSRGERGADPVVLRRGCRTEGTGGGWRRSSVGKGGSLREGVIGERMGDSSPRKRRDIVLGPGPAREELWDEENERRDER